MASEVVTDNITEIFYNEVTAGSSTFPTLMPADIWTGTIEPSSQTFPRNVTRIRELRATGYKSAIAKGTDATTNVSTSSLNTSSLPGDMMFYYTTIEGNSAWTGLRGSFILQHWGDRDSTFTSDEVIQQASLKFLLNAKRTQTRFSGSTFLGELRETLHMIRSPAKAAVSFLYKRNLQTLQTLRGYGWRYYNTVKPKHLPKFRKVVSDEWLKTQFGILPLLSDIDDGMKALAEFNNYLPRDHVTAQAERKESFMFNQVNAWGPWKWTERTIVDYKTSCIYRGSINARMSDLQPSIAKHFGFTWSDAKMAAWELLPWSFVIDYFTNIGDIIEASCVDFADLGWSNRTLRVSKTRTTFILGDSIMPRNNTVQPIMVVNPGSPCVLTETSKSVERLRTIPELPSLVLSIPGLGSRKWTNLLALAQRFI